MDWKTDTDLRITAGGKSLEARCYGPKPGEAPTIVLLHEGLGCVSLWRDFPGKLAEATGHGVLVYSRAGYGQSDPDERPFPLDYMTRHAIDVLPAVLDAIGFREGVLLGHSDGASIAAIYAGSVQDHRVRGLVLVAPHFFTEPGQLRSIAAAGEAFEAGELRDRLARHHADVETAFKGWNEAWLHPDFEAWNIEEVIDYFRIPVLAVQGTQDQYGSRAQLDVIAARSYAPVDIELIEGAAHAPFLDRPEETMAVIAEFVARLDRIEQAEVEVA